MITRHGGMASSYDCCLCGCPGQYNYTLLIPVITCPITVAVGNQVHGQVWYSPACGGTYYYFDMTTSLGWSSTNTSVFTLNNSSPKGLLTGVGVGSATAIAQGTTACQAWYMMGAVCQCSSWVTIVGNTPCSVIGLSQSPSSFNMSTGDSKNITVTVTPSGVPVTLSFSGTNSPTSNPNSSGAVTLTITGSGSGTINANVAASPAGNSGVYAVRGSASGATSSNSTTIYIPPQVLIQMINGEAGGNGSPAQLAVGVAARNRFGDCTYFSCVSTYQAAITPSQFKGLNNPGGQVTNGTEPPLDNAVQVWLNQVGNFISPSGGSKSACFWSPSATEWSQISAAVNSGTTDEAQVPNGTGCYSGATYNQQIRVVAAVGGNSSGVPWFVFQGPRASASTPVATQF